MRLLITRTLAGALLVAATAAPAAAQITWSSTQATLTGDPGYGGQTLLVNFESAVPGISYTGSYTIGTGLVSGFRAPPFGVTNNYFATPNVNGNSSGTAKIDFSTFLAGQSVNALSFYWGSIDSYNTLEVLGAGDVVLKTILGTDVVNPADGNQTASNTNRRLFLNFAGSSTTDFRALRLTSNGRAFEIDDIAGTFSGGGVVTPEPSTYAMLAAGLLAVGVAGRRRRRSSTQG